MICKSYDVQCNMVQLLAVFEWAGIITILGFTL